MYISKYNLVLEITAEVDRESQFIIFNPLSGAVDLATTQELDVLNKLKLKADEDFSPTEQRVIEYMLERGYLYRSKEEEEEKVAVEYVKFRTHFQQEAKQFLLVPTYACNLSCVYCYQGKLTAKSPLITQEMVDKAFEFIWQIEETNPSQGKPFITLFGGEPLINSPRQKGIIQYIISKCHDNGYSLSAVTNGVDLIEYCDLFSGAKVGEIQVTVDGPKEVHDKRRMLRNGKGTFDRIIAGIEAIIAKGYTVNFRVVVDRDNLESLPRLAELLDQKGWLDLGPERFKVQLGRNYELFDRYAYPEQLMTRLEMLRAVFALARQNEVMAKFVQDDHSGVKYIYLTGEAHPPTFDTCPACSFEWVLDTYGDVYGCTATCGRKHLRVGNFFPEISLNMPLIRKWQERDVLKIPQCCNCAVSLICGGGCGALAFKEHGSIIAPNCRPIEEILQVGFEYYWPQIREKWLA